MKQILPILILILYSILQARRKAMREQKKREATGAIVPKGFSAPLGAVTAEENRQVVGRESATMEVSDRWKNMTEEADRFVDVDEEEVPPEIQQVIAASRRSREIIPTAKASYAEVADPRLMPTPVVTVDAYEQVSVTRRRINFDKQSLRIFFVTREVLGPPRSRKPFRMAIKAHE